MDINFSAEDLAFRDEVREFFDQEYDSAIKSKLSSTGGEEYKTGKADWQTKTDVGFGMNHLSPVQTQKATKVLCLF